MKKIILNIALLTLTYLAVAYQPKGIVRGIVIDEKLGEPLIGVNVVVEGTTIGASTDLDGNFSMSLNPGTYNLVVSYISYATKKISAVEVSEDEVAMLQILMNEDAETLEEVVVIAKAMQNTDAALLSIQKKSSNVIDGISAQTFSKSGDGDAAAAIKRVPGVSIEGGKYVFVRGLGDRYSKSILNGMEIPGLDPERNTVQMDIFPTNIIDNIVVYKTFTPDLPGDFTGGLVDVTTKDFPDNKSLKLSASFGYNTITHFKDDFILYDGAFPDALALGGKSRALPFAKDLEPNLVDAQSSFNTTNALNKELEAKNSNTFLNQSYSISGGNQYNKERVTLGLNAAFNYKNSYELRPNYTQNETIIVTNSGSGSEQAPFSYENFVEQTGKTGTNEVLWSTMLSGSLKKDHHKIGLKLLHTQSGEKSATIRDINDIENTQLNLRTDLSYVERRISNAIISGEHLAGKNIKLNWANAFTLIGVNEPDRASSEFVINSNGDVTFNSNSNVDKVYRVLNEYSNNAKLDITLPIKQWKGLDTKLKFGVAELIKKRDFETFSVSIGKSDNFDPELILIEDGANSILATENLYSTSNASGYTVTNVQVDAENKFTSIYNILGAYAMAELPLHERIKFIGGLRVEHALINYTGTRRTTRIESTEKVLNSFQFLPSVNFVYNISSKDNKDMNLRASYSRTLARPSFREKSEAIIYDPVSGITFNGNINLEETFVHNADLRWEYFIGGGEIISLSAFYKKFINPIEIQPLENVGIDQIQPVNRDEADVIGLELEFRKSLAFIHQKLSDLILGTNFTYVKSMIELTEDQKDIYIITNTPLPSNRELVGQSPFIVNAFLSYNNPNTGTGLNLSYNVKGKTLSLAGVGDIPNVYDDPFHNLDFKATQKLGKDNQFGLSFIAKNLIGDYTDRYYEFKDVQSTYISYDKGRSFSLGFSWKL